MRAHFVHNVLNKMLRASVLRRDQSVLAVCAGPAERDVFQGLGFTDATITNLDPRMTAADVAPFSWGIEDAQRLSFGDQTFDIVFVADGLHHCSSPHAALLEMYRVARRGIVVIESRDSLIMRLANRLGLSPKYELESVFDHEGCAGGLNNSAIPNFVYRWTEREFRKVVSSYNPRGRHVFRFYYGLNLPRETAEFQKNPAKSITISLVAPLVGLITRLLPRQCNSIAMVALKPDLPGDLWPWLRLRDGEAALDMDYARRHLKRPGSAS